MKTQTQSIAALLSGLLMLVSLALPAQTGVRKHVRSGNKAYNEGDYQRAENQYRKALARDKTSLQGQYNLGGALYRQERYDEAYREYKQILDRESDSSTMSRVAYNFGNAALQRFLHQEQPMEQRSSMLNESIEAYSKALRYDPGNNDARHNLTRALRYRMQPPPPPERKPEEQHQQEKQKQEQPLPETRKQEEEHDQEQAPEHEEGRISKEDAERLLNAIREKEMQTAGQILERERKRTATPKGKDW